MRASTIVLGCVVGVVLVAGGCGSSRKRLQSNDILARQNAAGVVSVKHILVVEDALATDLLAQVKRGEPIEPLMMQYSLDPASAQNGKSYEVRPDTDFVQEFKDLSLRLELNEAGLVLTSHGWHIIKRVK